MRERKKARRKERKKKRGKRKEKRRKETNKLDYERIKLQLKERRPDLFPREENQRGNEGGDGRKVAEGVGGRGEETDVASDVRCGGRIGREG